jgi:hypothetical protein
VSQPSARVLGFALQGDGTAQLLCRDAAGQAAVCSILTQDLGVDCISFTVPPTTARAPAAPAPEPAAAPAVAAAAACGSKREATVEAPGGTAESPNGVHRALDSASELREQAGADMVAPAAAAAAAGDGTWPGEGLSSEPTSQAAELRAQLQAQLEEVRSRRYEAQAAQLALAAAEKALHAMVLSIGQGTDLL